jgi:uncharacterized CHY-type Zn-finger protein
MTVRELREKLGLPIYKPEPVECLACEQIFMSWNKTYNRRCPECRDKQNKAGQLQEEIYWDDLEDLILELDEDYFDFLNS